MKHQYYCQVGQDRMCVLCGKMDYNEGPVECPGTGAAKACAYYDGTGYVFIDRSNQKVVQAEVNSPLNWESVDLGNVSDAVKLNEVKAELELLTQYVERLGDEFERELAKQLAENDRLKARIRELEPEQPQPRPLYRWGRPV